jgi:hypothetical protein
LSICWTRFDAIFCGLPLPMRIDRTWFIAGGGDFDELPTATGMTGIPADCAI